MSKKSKEHRNRRLKSGQPSVARSMSHFVEKHIWWILLGLIFLGGLGSYLVFDPVLSTNGDNALYIVLGMSWAQGKGNSTICTPGEPANTMVPPGHPLLLAPLIALFPERLYPLKLLSTILFIFSLPLIMLMIRERGENVLLALGVALFASINANLLIYSSMVMTEMPFLFFSVLGLFLAQRSLRSSPSKMSRREKILFGLSVLSLVFAYHIRSIGIVLPAALLVSLIWKRRYRLAVVTGVAILCLSLPWAIRNATGVEGGGYLEQFFLKNAYNPALGKVGAGDLLGRIMKNLQTYGVFVISQALFASLSPLLSFKGYTTFLILLSILVTIMAMVGFAIRARRSVTLLEIYTLLFIGVCILWPEIWSGMRFVVPAIPLLIYYFLVGLWSVAKMLGSRLFPLAGKLLPAGVLIVMIFSSISAIAQASQRLSRYPSQWENYFQAAEWCRHNTSVESICVARKPSLFYLRARRKVLNYPYTSDRAEMMAFLAENNVNYVVVDGFTWTGTTRRYLAPAIQEHMSNFRLVYHLKNPDTWVLEIIEPAQEQEEGG